MKRIIIVGGGLAGLISANLLARAHYPVLLIERKSFPFHRVCGEYISNETVPFLKSQGLFPEDFNPPDITHFQLTSVNGKSATVPLGLGGFGISRYSFDYFLYKKAKEAGADFLLDTEVTEVLFSGPGFTIKTATANLEADLVIGAFGKRSRLDVSMKRNFLTQRSPYAAVKYHVHTQHPSHLIALHNFKDGYCGISQVDGNKFTICYLTHRDNLRRYGSIADMEAAVMFRNPFLKSIFANSEFLYPRPEVINEISFATKAPIENHLLMAGYAAGMITPLCGNGMALAIHSAKVLSELVVQYQKGELDRNQLEEVYTRQWTSLFARRLWAGRQVQKLFGNEWTSNLAVNLMRHSRPLADLIIRNTHGNPF